MALDLGSGFENGNVYATLMPTAAIKPRGRELVRDESFRIGPGIMNSPYQAAEIPRHEVIVVGRWNVDSRTPEI